jgi:hypothetical protein
MLFAASPETAKDMMMSSDQEYHRIYSKEYMAAIRENCSSEQARIRARMAIGQVGSRPKYKVARQRRRQAIRAKEGADLSAGRAAAGMSYPKHMRPSDETLREAERIRALDHPTITAALMGDPLPGRSALDRRA